MCLLQLQKQVKGFRLKCPKLPSALIWSTTQIISAQKWCYGGTFPLMDGVKVNFVEVYSISNGWRVKKKNKQHKPAQQLWCTLAYMIQVSGIVLNRWTLFFQKNIPSIGVWIVVVEWVYYAAPKSLKGVY